MDRWRRWFDRYRIRRLRTRFLVAMIALSVPPLAVLGYVSYNIAKDTMMESNARTNEDHLRTSSEVADLLFRNVSNLSRAVVLDEDIRSDLMYSLGRTEQERSVLRMRLQSQMQRLINSNFLDSSFVESICLYNLNYDAFCLGRTDDAGIYEGAGKQDAIRNEAWHRTATEAQGRVVFFSDNVLGDSSKSFSTVKLFRDAASIKGEPVGMLVINISKGIFGKIFTGTEQYGGRFLALDVDGESAKVVYPMESEGLPIAEGGEPESIVERLREEGYLVSQFRNGTTRWTFLHIVEIKELLKQSNQIGTFTALIAASIAFVAIAFSFFLSGSITRPLLRLKKMMLDWTKGARDFQETFAQDEVGAIGESFKKMALENAELSEQLIRSVLKEREAELRALQAQIKPHFLYNTLDSIYWMATLQKNEDIAQMAVSLSESFKLSLNKGKETIPVFKELKHVEHYLTIQNIRFNKRFTYVQDVDESILGMEMLKLLLQPLVENAIYHGLEPKVGEGTIRVTGKREDDFIVFAVEDDGVGIRDMAATAQGYGLSNVRERLALYYGPTSALRITSGVGVGTRVELRFQPTR
ncbi:sensor histidine kinase [Paenibacillus antri]|uniref:Sensor histidine kinase n=1 Tax=Paenibacillus antri TaxID=2582848 RepID=A0A5R9FXK4_9BACL|nr:sensor histidine kinase [Paenibacillus antri]TLS48772.1 sensor histidine kinase [Paenibacillus antri]